MNSPDSGCNEDEIEQAYKDNDCYLRLAGCRPMPQSPYPMAPCTGGVEYRFEETRSEDGTCVLQEDVYTLADGRVKRFKSTLQIGDQVLWVRRTKPIDYR